MSIETNELPRLYPQSRSGRVIKTPRRLWNSVFFCIEYPDGIFIDKKGIPRPDRVVGVPTDIVMDIVPESDRSLLPTFVRRAQKNLRDDLKCKTDNIEYYNDEDYTDKTESDDDTDSGTELDDDDSDDSTFSTDEEGDTDEEENTVDDDDDEELEPISGDISPTDSNEMDETDPPRKNEVELEPIPGDISPTDSCKTEEIEPPKKKQKCTTDTEQTLLETTTVYDDEPR
jgi:hypothetical protein